MYDGPGRVAGRSVEGGSSSLQEHDCRIQQGESNLAAINFNVLPYGCLSFLERRLASLLNGTVADRPQPLLKETIGVKEPCSTSMIL